MKKTIFKGIAVAAAAIAMISSCQIEEDTKTQAGTFKATATIDNGETRVEYTVNDNKISQVWETGDEIIGFDDKGGTFTFTVSEVDGNGKATFAVAGYDPDGATTLYAVFCPGKASDDFVDSTLDIDLTTQTGSLENDPAVPMCATGTVKSDNSVAFSFENQAAIIGVKKLKVGADEEVNSLTATGLTAKGQFKVDGGKLVLVPSSDVDDMTITFSSALTADAHGVISTPSYFIALPTADADICLKANTASAKEYKAFILSKDIAASKYYYTQKIMGSGVARYSNDGGATWTDVESLKAAIDGITDGADKANGKVEMLENCTYQTHLKFSNKKFTLNGNGCTFTIPSSCTVTSPIYLASACDVTFEAITIQGPGTTTVTTPRAMAAEKSSVITLGQDCVIKEFKNNNNGGAIYANSSTINMTSNATISDCHHTKAGNYGGGGIFCEYGNVNMSGDALITGCSAANNGGGLYIYTSSKLNMSGNATISGCTATQAGGAIYTTNSSPITLSDSVKIEKCKANSGGAIRNANYANTINISGSVHISKCEALSGSGGAICDDLVASSMTITDDVVIDNCTAATGRGGAFYHAGTFTVKGNVKIEGCSAKFGGGIAIWRSGTLDENVLIKNCTAQCGGAVYDTSGTSSGYGKLIIQGSASIVSCKADYHGSAIFETGSPSSVTINSGVFIFNSSTNCFIRKAGSMTINDGYFYQAGSGRLFTYLSISPGPTVKKGYFNKQDIGYAPNASTMAKSLSPAEQLTIDSVTYEFPYYL